MNEQAPNSPTPIGPDAHQQIAAQIEGAAVKLPSTAVAVNRDYEGQIRVGGDTSSTQLSKKDGLLPETAIGSAKTQGSTQAQTSEGAYGFRSTEDSGVEAATAMRAVSPRDGITRGGVPNGVYEHKFGSTSKDKAAQLITGLALKQAARDAAPPEAERKAA